jgi:hypothetical protein
MSSHGITYQKQWITDIFTGKKRKVAIIGAKGTAKTTYNMKLLLALLKGSKKMRILLTCGTREQVLKLFKQTIYSTVKHIPMRTANMQSLEFEFNTGVVLHLKSVETYKTAEGLEYDAWFADEFQDHSEEAVRVFHTRTRKARDRSLFRIVGMPDDPLHFMYSYFAENEYTLNEISLYEHPSQEWIDYYAAELKKVYSGAELDRFLHGKRVSLSGIGAFDVRESNKALFDFETKEDVHVVWDFNYEYRAVIFGQKISGIVHVTDSFQLKEPTLADDAKYLIDRLNGHTGYIYLRGDASGDNRAAGATETMWRQVRATFEAAFPGRVRYAVPRSNPPVKDTIQILKWALLTDKLKFHSTRANNAIMAVTAAKLDKYGEIDKSNDYKNVAAKSHEVDVVRYLAYDLLNLDYPINATQFKGAFV